MESRFPEPSQPGRVRPPHGARMVDALITNITLPEIGREFPTRLAAGSEINRVHLTAKDGNFAFAFD